MSHTIHWSNQTKEHLYPNYGTKASKFFRRSIPDDHRERLGNISSLLCLQADVLYPNALASVSATSVVERDPLRLSVDDAAGPAQRPFAPRVAVGCKGNQLDNEFPLEPRVPVALPLIQYATSTTNQLISEEHDACSRPVLNWEKYIQDFQASTKHITAVQPIEGKQRTKRRCKPRKSVRRESKMANARLRYTYEKRQQAELAKRNKDNTTSDNEDESEETDFSEDEEEALKESGNNRIQQKMKEEVVKIAQSLVDNSENNKKKGRTEHKIRAALKKVMFDANKLDVEEGYEATPVKSDGIDKEDARTLINNVTLEDFYKRRDCERVPLAALRHYTRQPEYKIKGTWNYLFNGHGACDWIRDPHDKNRRHILVGYGTKLRVATVKPSTNKQMFSYTLDNVWEEDDVPTNIRRGRTSPNEELSDLILQIVTARKGRLNNCLGAVRRGRSIEVYRFDESPSLVTSVGNVFYGTNKYEGHNLSTRRKVEGNPLLVSCDLNPWFPEEMTMLDENNILTFVDFARGRTVYQVSPARERHNIHTDHTYPEFDLNESSGITYASHPRTCYFWADSHIYFHDYRTELTKCPELLNLRYSAAARAWSEEFRFQDDSRHLLEAVSAVKQSSFPTSTYYHVGTTGRILLMDLRVPGNPVLKMDHGMKSPAAYLDTVRDDENYEVVIAGSQRLPEAFCAVHDTSHVACANRVECTARNPVLQSCPRHLLNPAQFYEFAETQGLTPSWESDNAKVKSHCYAWSTGLSVMKLSHAMSSALKPPGFAVFQGNCFGDIFYQEWDQRPIESPRMTRASSPHLGAFLRDWKESMTSKNPTEYHQESQTRKDQPENCALIVEVNADLIKKNAKVRTKPFSSFEQTEKYHSVKRVLKPLLEQVEGMRRLDTDLEKELLSVWENVPEDDESGAEQVPDIDQEQILEDGSTDLSASRNLTEDERRVLAEIKHEAERDYELVHVDDDEVCIIEDAGRYARGFELMEVDIENYRCLEEIHRRQEEVEELSRQLYPSVAEAFQTESEPEIILPHSVEPPEPADEWEDVAVSEMDSDQEQQQNVPDPDEDPVPMPIPLKINPERLEQEILGMSQPSRPEDVGLQQQAGPSTSPMQHHQQYESLVSQQELPPLETINYEELLSVASPATRAIYLQSQGEDVFSSQAQMEIGDYAVDDEAYFEATDESAKYDPNTPGPSGLQCLAAFDPESEAISAHLSFGKSSRRT